MGVKERRSTTQASFYSPAGLEDLCFLPITWTPDCFFLPLSVGCDTGRPATPALYLPVNSLSPHDVYTKLTLFFCASHLQFSFWLRILDLFLFFLFLGFERYRFVQADDCFPFKYETIFSNLTTIITRLQFSPQDFICCSQQKSNYQRL